MKRERVYFAALLIASAFWAWSAVTAGAVAVDRIVQQRALEALVWGQR